MKQIEEYFPSELLERFGSNVDEAAAAAVKATEGVIAVLEGLDGAQLGAPVAPGKWTPLEVADHLHRVTLLYIDGIERVAQGEEAVRHERGWVTEDGALKVLLPGAEPGAGLTLEGVVADLRASTQALVAAAKEAEAAGFADAVVHVNPYFGELTPLGTVRMAALHARHHRKRHLDALRPAAA